MFWDFSAGDKSAIFASLRNVNKDKDKDRGKVKRHISQKLHKNAQNDDYNLDGDPRDYGDDDDGDGDVADDDDGDEDDNG